MATVIASDSVAEAEPRKAEYLDWDLYRKDYKAWHARERRRKARVAKRAADAAAASTVDPDDEENDAQGIRKAAACAEKLEARRKRRVASQARINEIEAKAQEGGHESWRAYLESAWRGMPSWHYSLGEVGEEWRDFAVRFERRERKLSAQEQYLKRNTKRAKRARAAEAEREAAELAAKAECQARERAAAERAAAAAACVKLHKVRRRRRLAADAPRRAHIYGRR